MKNTNILLFLLLITLFSGASFFAGTKYQQRQSPINTRRAQFNNQTLDPKGIQNRQMMGRAMINGEIIAQDDQSVTIKLADGSSKIILLSSETSINQATQATVSDLKVDEKVAIFGQTNNDGSTTAQSIQLNPIQPNQPLLK